ncbi:putative Ig domain-containing protein [Larkinella sp.]|uniref:putative Ig domain-containing protein n=1 Tax=Larkinella sp. TaxID=2034517 RepID=UPI003BAC507E
MTHRYLIFFLFISLCSLQTATAQPRLFNASPSAQPGETVGLQGSFGASAKAFFRKGTATTTTALPIQVQSANQLTVQIPAQTGLDLYEIWVEDQGQRSPSVFVNQALGHHFDSPEVYADGTVRIFGRNLKLAGANPRVRLLADGSNTVHEALVNADQSDAYQLSLKLPGSLQAGVAYTVLVTNGLGGASGETRMESKLTAVTPGQDYFQLGVGWAAKLDFYRNIYNVKTDTRLSVKAVGNGVANDQPALQQAIDRAAADGGGIVYLPAGTYKLLYQHFEYLRMRNRVVIQGAGKGQTIIQFGYETGVSHLGVLWPEITRQAGLADLSLLNIDETGSERLNSSRGQGTEIFLQRVRFDLKRSDWLWLANSDKLVIANTDLSQGIDSRFSYRGPLQLDGCSNFVLRGNTFTYAVDGLNLDKTRDGVFENNVVIRDGSARYPTNTIHHVLIMNFAQNVAVLKNEFKVVNGPAQNGRDGETIISEGGGGDRIDEDAGTVSGATATTLQDQSKNWGSFRRQPVVAIVSGKGMGQWRRITSRSGSTLQLDRAWDVIPGAGSRYAVFNWGARNWLIQDNRLSGNHRGITLYHTSTTQVAIVNNTLLNSGSIDLTPIQQQSDGRQQFMPMYNTQIVGNTVSNTNGANGVFIGVHPVQHAQEKTFGTSVVGLEVRGNTLRAGVPNIPAVVDAEYPEGYLNYLEYHPVAFYQDEQVPAILGSIFENNTAINCNNALYVNSGSYNTLVCNLKLENSANAIRDDRFDRVSHAAMATVLCVKPSPTPTANKPPQPPSPTVLIAPLTAQVGVPFSGTLVAFTDPEGGTLTYGLSELPGGLSTNTGNRSLSATAFNHIITGTPVKEGTYKLTYSATDEQGAMGQVSFDLIVKPADIAPVVTGNFEGFLDKLECESIRGWVWDRNKPNTPLTVEFYLETGSPAVTTILGRTEANIYRTDLKTAGKGNGVHAYNFSPPAGLKNGAMVRARVLGSTYLLKGSPKAYQCANARLSAEETTDLRVTVLGNPVVGTALEIEIRGAEGQPVHWQLSDVQGRLITRNRVERAGAVERQTVLIAGQPAGLLWLRVSTTDQFKTVRVLKAE